MDDEFTLWLKPEYDPIEYMTQYTMVLIMGLHAVGDTLLYDNKRQIVTASKVRECQGLSATMVTLRHPINAC